MSPYGERIEGELTGFTYRTDDGGFAVARIRTAEGEAIAVGPLGHVGEGQHVAMTGRWSTHAQYGRRFRVESVMVDDPRTLRGLERYLGSGAVKGLGREFAKRVVAEFGLQTLEVIENTPEQLLCVPGIGKKRLARIIEHWENDRLHREVHATLRGHGIGQALSNRIVDKYGKGAMGVITNQPYRLAAEVRGVGFRTADAIAQAQGIARDHPDRAEAALEHLIRGAESDGHCFVPESELMQQALRLDVPPDSALQALDRLILQARTIRHDTADPAERPVYSPELDRAEAHVAQRLRALLAARVGRDDPTVDTRIDEQAVGIVLNEGQREAVRRALAHGVVVITGGPGTGKTTTVKVLLASAGRRHESWVLAAPTGRAARRLAETTGRDGKTLHRLLEFNPRTADFAKGPADPLDADAVLIDDASLVDLRLMAALLGAIPDGTRLVLVGDADQLPSVGAGRVLGDLIRSGEVPVATLSEVYRQAADSAIIRNAWRVNAGDVPISGEREPGRGTKPDFFVLGREDAMAAQRTVLEVVAKRVTRLGFDPLTDVQVLTPMHNGPLGTVALNECLQATLNPDGPSLSRGNRTFRVGDRVIQVKNDYDHDIFNGDTGRVVTAGSGGLIVDFDGRQVALTGESLDVIEPAWAISIHKSQGSEYRAVVVVLHRAHRIMLRRNLLYTAMTRAREFCCVVADPWALQTAVRTAGGMARWTRLADRLRET
ncbi:MAG: ATP-dependent RecD-like DNA helicase [Myxococcota bacterium]|nr:ATP-dependent RecD-like DNA helicase [Myxococcota bacterium]